ncbi:MAG TPA: septum formation initiator family protein [Mycobacteriales bacterium]|nr:septum formation initiator family protein [Mycobacteriales bacterium]
MLALACCAALLTLAYPLKQYLDQRSQISAARSEGAALQKQLDELTREHATAQDPATTEQQARERLHYTRPGQQNYIQLTPPQAAKPTVKEPGHAKVPIDPDATWYSRLWDSTVVAGKG